MHQFVRGLRFFIPVEVIDGHDANHIVLEACGKQFTLPAELLEAVADFGDDVAAAAEVPASVLTPSGAPSGTATAPSIPVTSVTFEEKPLLTVSDDLCTVRLSFVLKREDGELVPAAFEHRFAGPPSEEVGADARRSLQVQAVAWIRDHGYVVAAEGEAV